MRWTPIEQGLSPIGRRALIWAAWYDENGDEVCDWHAEATHWLDISRPVPLVRELIKAGDLLGWSIVPGRSE